MAKISGGERHSPAYTHQEICAGYLVTLGASGGKMTRKRVRLADVAEEAGVSASTASRALGFDSHLISAETRERVRRVAQRLGYRVNPIARSLRMSSTASVGMVVPSIVNPFFMELVAHVESCLADEQMALHLSNSRDSHTVEDQQIRSFSAGSVDGLIIVPCHEISSAPAIEHAAMSLPIVQLDRPCPNIAVPSVGVDDRTSIASIMDHLKGQGVKTLALVTNTGTNLSSMARVHEALHAAERLGMDLPERRIFEGCQSIEGGIEAAHALRAEGELPDAIVCLNDLLAFGVIAEMRKRGIRVPEDVLVTGFDDIQFAALSTPSLTTIRQPLMQIARTAVQILLHNQPNTYARTTFKGELIIRESSTRLYPPQAQGALPIRARRS